jgi:23S rRNA (uridine2552-2'-O)-methyltransferase
VGVLRKRETRHDFFYRKAKKEQYKSRAVYKLQEIHQTFKIFKRGGKVVDLCAHPGGWSQFASKKVGSNGIVIAVDLQPVKVPGVIPIVGDITSEETILQIEECLQGKCDVMLSDCSPNVSGHWGTDHARQIFLAQTSLELANKLLKKKGAFICKVFQGDLSNEHLRMTRSSFKAVRTFKPQASRKRSAEMYFIARGLLQ